MAMAKTTTFFTQWTLPHLIITARPDNSSDQQKKTTTKTKKKVSNTNGDYGFVMPLHYPRFTKEDYATMEEWKLDLLLSQYGLDHVVKASKSLDDKRNFAMGTFLWPDQL